MYDFSNFSAQALVEQKLKNLNFFKSKYAGIYDFFSNWEVESLALHFTPGESDINVSKDGVYLYQGGTVKASSLEARNFIKIFSQDIKISNFKLKGSSKPEPGRFSGTVLHNIVKGSPVSAREFDGYTFRGIVPSVLFLGVGLGIHIDIITKNVDIAHAIIYEPDPDFFALSLFVVDWEEIWRRFESFGRSLSFVISSNKDSSENTLMLENEMKRSVPINPDFLVFQSHNSNPDLIRKFEKVRENLPAILANRDMFDRQIEHFRQEVINLRDATPVLLPRNDWNLKKPVVVVGSGPSLDDRVSSIVSIRDRICLVTAGTSLSTVLSFGLEPDFHVELDADYVIYEILRSSLSGRDHNIKLIAKATVHPAVFSLFRNKVLFYSAETNNHHTWGINRAFRGASPTCTNAALSVVVNMGFKRIYLAGADFGFLSESNDHSSYSVYGDNRKDAFSEEFRARARRRREELFSVESVHGGMIKTQAAFFSAKLKVEALVSWSNRQEQGVVFKSISDGAKIEGVHWLDEVDFVEEIQSISKDDVLVDLDDVLGGEIAMDVDAIDQRLLAVGECLQRRALTCASLIEKHKVRDVADIVLLANELRQHSRWVPAHVYEREGGGPELMALQLLFGPVTDLVYLLLAHGLACSKAEVDEFFSLWKREATRFFEGVDRVFQCKVIEVNRQQLLGDASSFAHGKF